MQKRKTEKIEVWLLNLAVGYRIYHEVADNVYFQCSKIVKWFKNNNVTIQNWFNKY